MPCFTPEARIGALVRALPRRGVPGRPGKTVGWTDWTHLPREVRW